MHRRTGQRGDAPGRPAGPVGLARDAFLLLRHVGHVTLDDKVWRRAAAIAYYTLFALGPFLTLVLLASGALHRDPASLVVPLHRILGPAGGRALDQFLEGTQSVGPGRWGVLLGSLGLLVGASGAFAQLKEAINAMYGVERERRPTLRARVASAVKEYLLSASGVLSLLFLVLLTASLLGFASMTPVLGPALGLVATMVGFTLLFRLVPDAEVVWRDAAIGAAVTTLLLAGGQWVLAFALARTPLTTAYGVAGAAMALLIWVYVCALLTLFGAAFTRVWADRHGDEVRPDADAKSTPGAKEGRSAPR